MVTILRPPMVVTLDQGYGPPLTASVQRASVLLRFKQLITAAGTGAWTIVASSGRVDGVTWTVGLADYWATASAIQSAAPGSNHAWMLFQDPYGLQMLIDLRVVDTESAWFDFARSTDQFSTAGLSSLNAPASPVSAQSTAFYAGGAVQIVENTGSVLLHRAHVWRDGVGSVLGLAGLAGSGYTNFKLAVFRLSTSGVGYAADFETDPYFISVSHAGNNDVMNRSYFGTGGGWDSAGNPISVYMDFRNIPSYQGPAGSVSGNYIRHPMDFYTDLPEVAFRGRMPDFGVIPGAPSVNNRETGADAQRRIVVGTMDLITNGNDPLTL